MINARSETAAEKPFFRDAFKKRRCLIPASAFYEWKRDGETKSPHAIHRVDGAPLVFAGLWERWQGEAGDVLTAAVLTTSANATMAQIHDRMPCLIEKRDFAFWLDPGAPREALEWMLAPAKDDVLDLYPVSRAVNSARSEGAALLERV
jgi:putative SOS response-associated peptidase YedK